MPNEIQLDKTKDKEIKCNKCGKDIKKINHNKTEDYLYIQKKWNYFSGKDLTIHSFIVCEKCYDQWIQSFAIPVEEKEVIEVFDFPDD